MEIRNILEPVIHFYEKYEETTSDFGNAAIKEFWSTEEKHTCFVYNQSSYYIYQAWHQNLFNRTYNMTIYKNHFETTLDISYIYDLLERLGS